MLNLARGGAVSGRGSASVAARAAPTTRASDASDGTWAPFFIGPRYAHGAVYDPVRDRMLVFGGAGVSDVWSLWLGDTPTWTPLLAAGTPPSVGSGQSAIYDPVRDRMIVFGGVYASYLNDVWTLSLGGTPTWTILTPTGAPPDARAWHSAIYDPVRDRMLVFGGYHDDGHPVPPPVNPVWLNDVWALSLAGVPAWTLLAPTGGPPPVRKGHSAIYDPVRDRMVVFGGHGFDPYTGDILLRDVWALTLAGAPAWTAVTPPYAWPIAREAHSAVYDPVSDRMIVFGGYDGYSRTFFNDAWALSLADSPVWTSLTSTGTTPGVRGWHSAIYDPVRERMVVFGGRGVSGDGSDITYEDVQTLSLANTTAWADVTPRTAPPGGEKVIYDAAGDRMVVIGGSVWALLLSGKPDWEPLTPAGTPPSPRDGESAIYDPIRQRMLVFGGQHWDNTTYHIMNDVWELSLTGMPTWTLLTPLGTPPSPRALHTAIYDPVRDRMVVFGGLAGAGGPELNDVWALWLAGTPTWAMLPAAGTPPSERESHSAIYDPVRDRMVVFGGWGGPALTTNNELWSLSLAGTPTWAALTPGGTPPSPRAGHSAIYDAARDRMVMFEGDLWELSLAGTTAWRPLTPAGIPPNGGPSSIYDPVRDRMLTISAYALWFGSVLAVEPATPPAAGFLRPAPNPSRGATTVSYSIARAGRVRLVVYDLGGRLARTLVDGDRRAGTESVVWNGTSESGSRLGAGVYFIRLEGPGVRLTRKVILLK